MSTADLPSDERPPVRRHVSGVHHGAGVPMIEALKDRPLRSHPTGLLLSIAFALTACSPKIEASDAGGATNSISVTATSSDSSTSGGDAGDATTSADETPPPCLPGELHGPWIAAVAGWNLYEAIDDADYMLEHPGDELLINEALVALHASHGYEPLFDLWGFAGIGISACKWPLDPDYLKCLSVSHGDHASTIEELTAAFSAYLAEVDGCFGVRVTLLGYDGPRCDADDPECLPVPSCPSCVYTPGAARSSTFGGHEGACAHDGECYVGYCGECEVWTTPGSFEACAFDPDACRYCGCLDGLCQWFTQDVEEPGTCPYR